MLQFATERHAGQLRKYTNEPYIVHPIQVCGMVSTLYSSETMKCIALGHDLIEDTETTFQELNDIFGLQIAHGIHLLSDMETGNRATRKALSRERLALAPAHIQDIKVCDLICNTPSIVTHDPEFAKVYLKEKKLLLDVLTKASPELILMARQQIEVY